MAELEPRETARGDSSGRGSRTSGPSLASCLVQWPDACQADESAVHCGQAGLRGTLEVDRPRKVVFLSHNKGVLAGRAEPCLRSHPCSQSVQLFGSAEDQRGIGELARAYTVLGVEHPHADTTIWRSCWRCCFSLDSTNGSLAHDHSVHAAHS